MTRRLILFNLLVAVFVAVSALLGAVPGMLTPLPFLWVLGALVGTVAALFVLFLVFNRP